MDVKAENDLTTKPEQDLTENEGPAESCLHPIASFENTNRRICELLEMIEEILVRITDTELGTDIEADLEDWLTKHLQLQTVEEHYTTQEKILFPFLESHGLHGPPSVLRNIHDRVREGLDSITRLICGVKDNLFSPELLQKIDTVVEPFLHSISRTIYKEESMVYPMCLNVLTEKEWDEMTLKLEEQRLLGSQHLFGRDWVGEGKHIRLMVGFLTADQINLLLTHLPINITYVDENDLVCFYTLGIERLLKRSRNVIGRKFRAYYPGTSPYAVTEILKDLKRGRKDSESFSLHLKGRLLLVRYVVLRDNQGVYRGILEIIQDASEFKDIGREQKDSNEVQAQGKG